MLWKPLDDGIFMSHKKRGRSVKNVKPERTGKLWTRSVLPFCAAFPKFQIILRVFALGLGDRVLKNIVMGSSQFLEFCYFCFRPQKHLDGKHSVFGRVVGGLEVLAKLEQIPVDETDKPTHVYTAFCACQCFLSL